MSINIHALRNGSTARDRAIIDLLHLQQLGLVPGSVTVRRLKALWGLSQPQVSRRLAAVHQLGIYAIRAGWGRYRFFTTEELRAQRYEAIRRKLLELVE